MSPRHQRRGQAGRSGVNLCVETWTTTNSSILLLFTDCRPRIPTVTSTGCPEVLEPMRPGPLIRRSFGPYERVITEAYRRVFTKLDDFIGLVLVWVPQARRILEVGCGEGAITERLVEAYPD